MNSILKVTKYQIHDFKKSIAIFYTVIFLLLSVIGISITRMSGEVTFAGFGLTTAVFIFIAGLNCFKLNFKFMMANNVSRKRFYYGNIIALVIIAAFMALVDSILGYVLNLIIPYESVIVQLYNKKIFLDEFLWSFGLYTLFICLGWLITMLYYRCNKIMKTIISIIPIPIIILLQYIEQESGGVVGRTIMGFLDKALGFAYNNNTYIGTLSFFAGTAVLLPICFLLIRKAPIKD